MQELDAGGTICRLFFLSFTLLRSHDARAYKIGDRQGQNEIPDEVAHLIRHGANKVIEENIVPHVDLRLWHLGEHAECHPSECLIRAEGKANTSSR